MSDGHQVGPDVDLDAGDVRDRQGRRVTSEIAREVLERYLRGAG